MSWYCLDNKEVVARKQHNCYLCDHPINKGDIHVSRSGIGDYGPVRIHMHIDCEKHTQKWKDDDWELHDVMDFREMLQYKTTLTQCMSGEVTFDEYAHKSIFINPFSLLAKIWK
jgi:hypothetical protein